MSNMTGIREELQDEVKLYKNCKLAITELMAGIRYISNVDIANINNTMIELEKRIRILESKNG